MAIVARLKEFLDASHVPYEVHPHPRALSAVAVARADHVPATEMAKVLLIRSQHDYLVAVLPASRRLDLHRLEELVGERLELAREEEVDRLFPRCERGAMPPFGNLFGLPVWVDDSLGREAETVFNGGTHAETVHMAFADFARLAEPSFGNFGELAN